MQTPFFRPLLLAVLAALLLGSAHAAPRSSALASLPTTAPGEVLIPGVWHAVGPALEPSLLRVPACPPAGCPLVVVSHPRAQTPERLRDSPGVSVLTGALEGAGYAVLLSADGGPTTWGSPEALGRLSAVRAQVVRQFPWNGRTYALGLSMGGLTALRSAAPGSPYPVLGVALIDAWTDVAVAWGSAASRRAEIEAAYAQAARPGPAQNPLDLVLAGPPLPLLAVTSVQDGTVPPQGGALRVLPHAESDVSVHILVPGPHLGGNRFTPEIAGRLVAFYGALERRAEAAPKAIRR